MFKEYNKHDHKHESVLEWIHAPRMNIIFVDNTKKRVNKKNGDEHFLFFLNS